MASAVTAIYQNGERNDLSAARAKLAATQEELVRLKVDRERGALLPADEVVAGWQSAIGRSRALLLGIPSAVADTVVFECRKHADPADAARAVRELLVKLIDGALNELINAEFDDEGEPEATS
jgi:phage terminase Nu1 subunit (DNA packaging protein)